MISNTIVNDIRAEIASVINGQSALFGEVSAYPTSSMDSFPAVIIMPSENSADYGSTIENRFVFFFNLYIYYPTKDEAEFEKTETAVGEAVGELLRIFSQKGLMTTCLWVEPIPTVWGDTAVGDTPYRTATVTLKCTTLAIV